MAKPEEYYYHFSAIVNDVVICGAQEIITPQTTFLEYGTHLIKLSCAVGLNMERAVFYDDNLENLKNYCRGMFGSLSVRFHVHDFYGVEMLVCVDKFNLIDYL